MLVALTVASVFVDAAADRFPFERRPARPHTIELDLFGMRCLCLDLDKLIEVKRAAGRPKDLEVLAELEAIREETGR